MPPPSPLGRATPMNASELDSSQSSSSSKSAHGSTPPLVVTTPKDTIDGNLPRITTSSNTAHGPASPQSPASPRDVRRPAPATTPGPSSNGVMSTDNPDIITSCTSLVISTNHSARPVLKVERRRSPGLLKPGQVRVQVYYTTTSPLDLWPDDENATDGHIMGYNIAGRVLAVFMDAEQKMRISAGDEVFGFLPEGKGHQETIVTDFRNLGIVPNRYNMQRVVGVSADFMAIFRALSTHLGLWMPWPKPEPGEFPSNATKTVGILIWGGHTARGRYAMQILKYYGFSKVFTFMPRGCTREQMRLLTEEGKGASIFGNRWDTISLILDCVSTVESMRKIAKHAISGNYVALGPILRRPASHREPPKYSMTIPEDIKWLDVAHSVVDIRNSPEETQLYETLADLQTQVLPVMLESEVLTPPTNHREVDGQMTLNRAQKALIIAQEYHGDVTRSRAAALFERLRLRSPAPPRDDGRIVWRVCGSTDNKITPDPQ